MKRSIVLLLTLSAHGLLSAPGLGGSSPLPIITDNSPRNFQITWRNDTGVPNKFGPALNGLRWDYKGTTKRGLEVRFSGAYIPTFNDIKVARFEPAAPYGQLAQWQFTIDDSLKPGEEHAARGGGVSKEPISDGLLPGFRTVTFTVTRDREGEGWTAILNWSNPDVAGPKP